MDGWIFLPQSKQTCTTKELLQMANRRDVQSMGRLMWFNYNDETGTLICVPLSALLHMDGWDNRTRKRCKDLNNQRTIKWLDDWRDQHELWDSSQVYWLRKWNTALLYATPLLRITSLFLAFYVHLSSARQFSLPLVVAAPWHLYLCTGAANLQSIGASYLLPI